MTAPDDHSPRTQPRTRNMLPRPFRWTTVSAVPSDGWCNQYRDRDGNVHHEPCPGLLIQERHGQRRVAFATYLNGCLTAACDNPLYEDSLPPGSLQRGPKRQGPPPVPENK